jgi:hypothetical protein
MQHIKGLDFLFAYDYHSAFFIMAGFCLSLPWNHLASSVSLFPHCLVYGLQCFG